MFVLFPGTSSLTRGLRPVVRLRRALLAFPAGQNLTDPSMGISFQRVVYAGDSIASFIFQDGSIPCKPDMSLAGMINSIENLRQISAVKPGRTFVEKLQLRHTGPGKVIKHNPGFGVPVAALPDTRQSRRGGCNDVPSVLSGGQFIRGHIAVVRLFNGEQ